jgi:hypothetical protein
MTEQTLALIDLADVDTFEEAFQRMADAGLTPHVVNQFDLIKDKDALLGIPFLILDFGFHAGDYGDDGFVSVSAITDKNRKVVFTDGSGGIRAQLRGLHEKGILSGIICKAGLRKSDYFVNEKTGETSNTQEKGMIPASTYYLD